MFPTSGLESQRLDYIFNTLDDWLLKGECGKVNQVLEQVDTNTWDIVYLIGYLTITLTWPLPARPEFFQKVKERLQQEAPERVENLLRGLD